MIGWVCEDGHTGHFWHRFLEQLQPFPSHLRGRAAYSRDVPPWPGEAGDEPLLNGVAHDHAHDGDRARGVVGSADCWVTSYNNDDFDLEADELCCQLGETLCSPLCIPHLHDEVLALHPAEFTQGLLEGFEAGRG